ncbi:MAG TPA: phosphotransferase [Acidimicrobiales bacterium]|nr:phosphotransferase [Acidimicrobiales bacterium]
MKTIPGSIDEVTPEWLSEVMGCTITAAPPTQIGAGIGVSSALYRLPLAITGDRGGCPETVVVKLPALDEAAVFTSTVLRMYIREVGFFEKLAAQSPIRVPRYHHGAVDEETSKFIVVMEDLGGMRIVDQLEGMAIADAEQAVDELARWHAQWWGKVESLVSDGIAISLGDPIYPAILPLVFGEGWAKVTEGMEVLPSILEVGPRFSDAMAGLLADLSHGPQTLAHGDYRADNILFADDGSVALLDFQLIGGGSGAYDLAYFITQSLDPDVASANEKSLFDRWTSGLQAAGVPAGDLDGLWEQYRKAALFCLVYPIVASRGMDLSDPRQHGLVDCMNTRIGRAIDELDLSSLL